MWAPFVTNLMSLRCGLSFYKLMVLTRLSRLNRTSLLPSSCNLDKIFALTGHFAQVHMANKKFPIFLHAGRVNRKREISWQFSIAFILRSFRTMRIFALIAQSAERQTKEPKVGGTSPTMNYYILFFCIFLSSWLYIFGFLKLIWKFDAYNIT